uniref:Alpha-1,4-glucan-protein synthase n=1 Tax=Arundo donax TaxID=35708 RepID=A0A0A9ENY6_ARUDO
MRPPSLLSLTLDSALLRIAHIADLSHLPDHLVIDLFRVGTPAPPSASSNLLVLVVTCADTHQCSACTVPLWLCQISFGSIGLGSGLFLHLFRRYAA